MYEFRAQFLALCLGESFHVAINEIRIIPFFTSQENRGGELSTSCSDAETPQLYKYKDRQS